jgi:two-component system invasion response regulator UvrY
MNILLLEDHPIFRLGVRQLVVRRWPEASVTEAGTLAAAVAAVRQQRTDLGVVDLNLPDASGHEAIAQLLRAAPGLRLLVVSLNSEADYARRALQMGAAGYLAKDRAPEELVAALERIADGGRYITASLAEQLADLVTGRRGGGAHEELSVQEYRVMIQLAAGQRLTDIGERMHLSPKTVSTYRSRILEKLGLENNAELTRYCLAHKLMRDLPFDE